VCARHLFLCAQRQCPDCGVHKVERFFHRSSTCWQCRRLPSTSTSNISLTIDPSSFAQFFNHEATQGSHLSLIQRSSLLTLHALGIDDDQVAHLTGCDRRIIHHNAAHFKQHHSLVEKSRSIRLCVTSPNTEPAIVSTATKITVTTRGAGRCELGVHVSARTARRQLVIAAL
jgi:hypothetical protein